MCAGIAIAADFGFGRGQSIIVFDVTCNMSVTTLVTKVTECYRGYCNLLKPQTQGASYLERKPMLQKLHATIDGWRRWQPLVLASYSAYLSHRQHY